MIDWKRLWKHDTFEKDQKKVLGAWIVTGRAWFDHQERPVCKQGEYAVVMAENTSKGLRIVGILHRNVKTRQEAKWLQTLHTMGEGITEEERHNPELAMLSRMMPMGEYFKAIMKDREKKAREKERLTKLITGV